MFHVAQHSSPCSRILLVPVFAIAFVLPGDTARLIAFAIFCIAGRRATRWTGWRRAS